VTRGYENRIELEAIVSGVTAFYLTAKRAARMIFSLYSAEANFRVARRLDEVAEILEVQGSQSLPCANGSCAVESSNVRNTTTGEGRFDFRRWKTKKCRYKGNGRGLSLDLFSKLQKRIWRIEDSSANHGVSALSRQLPSSHEIRDKINIG
jgi:hypothetical protein